MARMVIAAMLLQAALGLLAPTRHLSRAPALHATNADWRSKCDSDGVVAYYDYGVRLGKEPSRHNPKSHTTTTMPTIHRVARTHTQII